MVVGTWKARVHALVFGLLMAIGFAACSGSDAESATPTSAATEPEASTPQPTEPESSETTGDTTAESAAVNDDSPPDRPFDVFVPTGYDPATPMPLVLMLHGYTGTGDRQESYVQFEPLAESRGFLYVTPDGTEDRSGAQFWNATDACCAFGNDPPDDAAYLMSIIEEVSAEYSVDPKAIFLAGHSNGGFMSYRMACEHADTIAGIASLAGATFADPADCSPTEPVSVLQIHGTNDDVISYNGGALLGNTYPSAQETVAFWATHNGCGATPSIAPDVLDLDRSIDGAESDTQAFGGCEQGTQVELWTIDAGSHGPALTEEFSAEVVDFLLAHPKP